MIDTTNILKYTEEVAEKLGDKWMQAANLTHVGNMLTVGSIAKSFCISCYLDEVAVAKCVALLQEKFPLDGDQ